MTYRLVILQCLLVVLITLASKRFTDLCSEASSEGCGVCYYPYLTVASREGFCGGEVYLRLKYPMKPSPEIELNILHPFEIISYSYCL